MTNPFTERMARCSDSELIGIVGTYRSDYQPEAIEAAEFELQRRDIPIEVVELVDQKIGSEHHEKVKKANLPIDIPLRGLSFLFPGFIPILIAGMLKAQGYDRKFQDARRWTFYGIFFYVTLAILLSLTGM
jgi:hypothetical protein